VVPPLASVIGSPGPVWQRQHLLARLGTLGQHRVGHSGEQVLDLIIASPSGELVKELLKRFP
jgi:hypothetical protein